MYSADVYLIPKPRHFTMPCHLMNLPVQLVQLPTSKIGCQQIRQPQVVVPNI